MRYLAGFLCVFALGLMPVVGCSSEATKCDGDWDCIDDDPCTVDRCNEGVCDNFPGDGWYCELDGHPAVCVSGVCAENPCDDGNECTKDLYGTDGSCFFPPVYSTSSCDFDGVPGVCLDGVCSEDPCEGVVCDDGDTCTLGRCDFRDGTCRFTPQHPPGTPCTSDGFSGVCVDGVCGEDPCEGVVCDDGDLCTDDSCWLGECQFFPRCYDSNVCTDEICDPETGECDYPPADGKSCCLQWEFTSYCGVWPDGHLCIPDCHCCTNYGICQNASCVDDD